MSNGGKISLSRCQRYAWSNATERRHHAGVAIFAKLLRCPCWTSGRRHVDIVLSRILWNRRKHANNGVRAIVHPEDLPYNVGIAALMVLPVVVTQNQNQIRVSRFIALQKTTAEERLDSQYVKEIVGDDAGLHSFGR